MVGRPADTIGYARSRLTIPSFFGSSDSRSHLTNSALVGRAGGIRERRTPTGRTFAGSPYPSDHVRSQSLPVDRARPVRARVHHRVVQAWSPDDRRRPRTARTPSTLHRILHELLGHARHRFICPDHVVLSIHPVGAG